MALPEFVMQPVSVNAPVLPAMDDTEPAEAIELIRAYFNAPEAAESDNRTESPAAGLAFWVRPGMVKSVTVAVLPVVLPFNVKAAACERIALVTTLVDTEVTTVPEVDGKAW